jgi:hypothetical protein
MAQELHPVSQPRLRETSAGKTGHVYISIVGPIVDITLFLCLAGDAGKLASGADRAGLT